MLNRPRASWFVRHLVTKYPSYNVVSFDKLDYCSSLNNVNLLGHYENYHFVRGDVAKTNEVMNVLDRFRIDSVFHFAARTHVDDSFGDSREFLVNNTVGTDVVLSQSASAGIKRFYYVSTDEVIRFKPAERGLG